MGFVGENLHAETGQLCKSRPFATRYAELSLTVRPILKSWTKTTSGMNRAVMSIPLKKQQVPSLKVHANTPWISPGTLELLRQRPQARLHGRWDSENRLRMFEG